MSDVEKPEKCPKCGSIFVDWDRYQKRYRCLVRSCGWIVEHSNKKTKNYVSSSSKLEKVVHAEKKST